MERKFRNLIFSICTISLLCMSSCGVVHHGKPIKEETIVHYVDSTRWHDTTIVSHVTKERYVDLVKPMDTLKLETTYAKAQAYMDTTFRALRGTIENKSDVPIKTQIKWKDRIVYKDSIVTKEVPIEVIKEVTKYPKSYWWFMGISIAALLYIILKVYLKFIKK